MMGVYFKGSRRTGGICVAGVLLNLREGEC